MVYWFRPDRHFNVVRKEVYECLQRFYGEEYFRITKD